MVISVLEEATVGSVRHSTGRVSPHSVVSLQKEGQDDRELLEWGITFCPGCLTPSAKILSPLDKIIQRTRMVKSVHQAKKCDRISQKKNQ